MEAFFVRDKWQTTEVKSGLSWTALRIVKWTAFVSGNSTMILFFRAKLAALISHGLGTENRQYRRVCVLLRRDGQRASLELVGGNDQLGVGVAAHPVDSAGGASSDGIGVAARTLGRDGDRAIGAA